MIIAVSFVLLFVLVPLGLLMVFGRTYGNGAKLSVLIVKLIISGIVYLIASGLTVMMLMLSIIGSDPKPGGKPEFGDGVQLICLSIIAGYGFTGWLLCSFVNGKFIKFHSVFTSFTEKPRSIFSGDRHG